MNSKVTQCELLKTNNKKTFHWFGSFQSICFQVRRIEISESRMMVEVMRMNSGHRKSDRGRPDDREIVRQGHRSRGLRGGRQRRFAARWRRGRSRRRFSSRIVILIVNVVVHCANRSRLFLFLRLIRTFLTLNNNTCDFWESFWQN